MEPDRGNPRDLTQLSSNGSQGHLVQIVDPAEETFPYSGRIEFTEPEGAGEITAGRAENWRADYERAARAPPRRNPRRDRQLGWSFTIHRTDRPANELLMALHARIGEGNDAAMTNRRPHGMALGRSGMMGLPLGFAQPLVLLGLLSLPVLWWILRLIPPRPRRDRVSADAAVVRHQAEGRHAGPHAVVADVAAARCWRRSSSSPPPVRCGIRRSRPRPEPRRSRS